MSTPLKFACVVSANLIARAANCVSKDEEARFYLTGVHVEPCSDGGALIVATDGRCMVVFHDQSAHVVGSGTLTLSPAMLTACGGERGAAVLAVKGDAACVATWPTEGKRASALKLVGAPTAAVVAAQGDGVLLDGSYPEWRRVVPAQTFPDRAWGAFNPSILARVTKALCTDKNDGVSLISTGDRISAALVFASSTWRSAFGVVMPMRETLPDTAPAWIKGKVA